MPEHENSFTPENSTNNVDITEEFLNSESPSDFAEYINNLPPDAKIVLNIDIMDADPKAIRMILNKRETAQVIINGTNEDKEQYKEDFPGVEWRVKQQ